MSRAEWLEAFHPGGLRAWVNERPADIRKLLPYNWNLWGRPDQHLPAGDDWTCFVMRGGRGAGKTRAGSELSIRAVRSGQYDRWSLVGLTIADVRDTMIEGESGILRRSPPWFRPRFKPSRRRLEWPNGAISLMFSADEPDRFRGAQHHGAWFDEVAAARYPESLDQLLMGLRLGRRPILVATSTPRPTREFMSLLADPRTRSLRVKTTRNAAHLSPQFLTQVVARYAGTRLGRQELEAELLTDVPGALWTYDGDGAMLGLNDIRLSDQPEGVEFVRIAVAVDPAATSEDESDFTGIVVVALGDDGLGYVLEDCSIRGRPGEWGTAVLEAYDAWGADVITAEINQGGEMVEHVIRTCLADGMPMPHYNPVRAARGEYARAEPVSAMYGQGLIRHIGLWDDLEKQMTSWVPGKTRSSPDRMDSLVWGFYELFPNLGSASFEGLKGVQEEFGQKAENSLADTLYVPRGGVVRAMRG